MISDLPIDEEREENQQKPASEEVEEDNNSGDDISSPPEESGREAGRTENEACVEEKAIAEDDGDDVDMKAVSDGSRIMKDDIEHSMDMDDEKDTFLTESGLKVRADLYDGAAYSMEEYEEMAKLYDETFANISEGEVVEGTVMKIQGNSVVLDVGFKSEGAVSLEEFTDPDSLSVGDKVDVYLENLEDQEGVIVFSKKKADFLKVWDSIKESFDTDTPIEGTIARKIKGGMVVDVFGVDAFLPGSQIDLRRVNDLDSLIGVKHFFKIIKLNKRRRNVVVSRRIILEEERESKRTKLLAEIEVGQTRNGEVKNITDFGAFIDLGGVDGLLHITDMSWGRISHPSELATIGDRLDVKILDIDLERGRISLGLKQLTPYPWEDVEKKYPVGDKVRGKVVSLTNYGAFVELEKGVEGLVHVSEMSWTRHIRHPSKILAIGDIVDAIVLNVDQQAEKISLGIKQVDADPWLSLAEKYPTGTHIEGKVRNLTSFGGFVEIEEGIDGLVHVSDMSWTRRVMHPSEVLKKGEKVEVVVLNIDAANRRISLGLKQVQEDPWGELSETYSEGTETTGKIARILEKGLVVDLGDNVEGFVPISQVKRSTTRPLDQEFNLGDTLALEVIECDRDNRRIVLSAVEVIARSEVVKSPAADAESEADKATADDGGATADDVEKTDDKPAAEIVEDAEEKSAPQGAEEVEEAVTVASPEESQSEANEMAADDGAAADEAEADGETAINLEDEPEEPSVEADEDIPSASADGETTSRSSQEEKTPSAAEEEEKKDD